MDVKGKRLSTAPTPNNTPGSLTVQPQLQKHKKSKSQDGMVNMQSELDSISENISPSVLRRLKALENLQDKHAQLDANYREEVLALQAKYLELKKPLYSKRTDFITGRAEPTDEESERVDSDVEEELNDKLTLEKDKEKKEEKEEKEEKKEKKEKKEDVPTKGIPEFWLTVFENNPLISELISEADSDALKYLEDITLSLSEDRHAYTLEFTFASNPYFIESTLTKTYTLQNEVSRSIDDLMYVKSEGSKITWKDGKNLGVRIELNKQKNKVNKKVRTVKKEVPQETFFDFFSPPQPIAEEDMDEEFDEDLRQHLEERIELDFEIGEALKEKIIPRAIDWYTGKALQYDDFQDDYDEEELSDGDEDDEDGDDDEDDDDDDVDANKSTKPGEKPAECAQQ